MSRKQTFSDMEDSLAFMRSSSVPHRNSLLVMLNDADERRRYMLLKEMPNGRLVSRVDPVHMLP